MFVQASKQHCLDMLDVHPVSNSLVARPTHARNRLEVILVDCQLRQFQRHLIVRESLDNLRNI